MIIIPEPTEATLAILALIAKDKQATAKIDLAFSIDQSQTLGWESGSKESSYLSYSSSSEEVLKLITQNMPLAPASPDKKGIIDYNFARAATALAVHVQLMTIVKDQFPEIRLLDYSQNPIQPQPESLYKN